MIHYVRHRDIDKQAWDARLAAAPNAYWYGTSSVMDAASPGWDALVDEHAGAQMPLPWRMKFGIRYLFQPFVIQHLGPYSARPSPQDAARFLEAVPKEFRYADIYLMARDPGPMRGLRTEECTDHVLPLDRPVEALRAAYTENHRRSVRKAAKLGVRAEHAAALDEVIRFFERSEQFRRWGVDAAQREVMRRVFRASVADGTGFGKVVRREGVPIAAAWFVRWGGRLIFLKGLGNAEARERRAMHALVDQVVAEHAATGLLLDFAGGNDPQLARFYSGFGAVPALYLRALMNRLPPLVRRMKP